MCIRDSVYVPRRGEADAPPAVEPSGPGGPSGSSGGSGSPPSGGAGGTSPPVVVDLNRAGAPELEQLPGVGPATAAAILDYRRTHGPFRAVDDLTRVRGIGPAKLAQLRDRVRV